MRLASVVSPAPRHEWEALLHDDPTAVIEQTPVWTDALAAAGRFRDVSRLYRFSDGRAFVLPLVARSRFGPHTGFGTGWGIGGLVGPDPDAEAASMVMQDLAALGALYTHIRPNPLQAGVWAAGGANAVTVERRAHVVDLAGGPDAVWDRFRKSGRRGVKKAEAGGVEVTLHTGGDRLDIYYRDLYLPSVEVWAERQNEPAALARARTARRDPLAKLHSIAAALGPAFRLYLARFDGRVAAGNIVLWGPHNAHATRGAVARGVARNGGYAADWAAIRDAARAGFGWYQMGESGQNQSLSEYKERFGAVAVDYAEYRFERLPLLAADRAARSAVKRLIGFRD